MSRIHRSEAFETDEILAQLRRMAKAPAGPSPLRAILADLRAHPWLGHALASAIGFVACYLLMRAGVL